MTVWAMGMSVATGKNYSTQRVDIEAESITDAIRQAEEAHPGYRVHHAWCIEGCKPIDESGLDEWMKTYQPGVLRTQAAG